MDLDRNELNKARLAKLVLSNSFLKDGSMQFEYKKPFDVLVNLTRHRNWWSNPAITQRLQPHVILSLPLKYNPDARSKIIDYYLAGLFLREIEKRGGGNRTKIRRTLSDAGLVTRKFTKGNPEGHDLTKVMRAGNSPYGFCYLDGKLVLDNREQQIIHRIVDMKANGMSYRAIARALNEQNVRTRMGKSWKHEVVKTIYKRTKGAARG